MTRGVCAHASKSALLNRVPARQPSPFHPGGGAYLCRAFASPPLGIRRQCASIGGRLAIAWQPRPTPSTSRGRTAYDANPTLARVSRAHTCVASPTHTKRPRSPTRTMHVRQHVSISFSCEMHSRRALLGLSSCGGASPWVPEYNSCQREAPAPPRCAASAIPCLRTAPPCLLRLFPTLQGGGGGC